MLHYLRNGSSVGRAEVCEASRRRFDSDPFFLEPRPPGGVRFFGDIEILREERFLPLKCDEHKVRPIQINKFLNLSSDAEPRR